MAAWPSIVGYRGSENELRLIAAGARSFAISDDWASMKRILHVNDGKEVRHYSFGDADDLNKAFRDAIADLRPDHLTESQGFMV